MEQLNKSEWAKMPGDEMNTEEEKSYYNGYTEDKPDLNQDIFNYIHNLTGSTLLFDELGGLISIFEKHGWDKKVWQKEKPDYPCLFVARWKEIKKEKLLTLDKEGNIVFQGTYSKIIESDLQADEYFVIERF